jgi:hypothetical protein
MESIWSMVIAFRGDFNLLMVEDVCAGDLRLLSFAGTNGVKRGIKESD